MLIFFIISLVVTVCLYSAFRELQEKNGAITPSSRDRRRRETVGLRYEIDISDRSENSRDVHNPMDNHGSSADDLG